MGLETLATLGSGRMLGPYRLLERLGRGAAGQVWLAERVDQRHGLEVPRRFALKIRPVLDGEGGAYDFLREWVLSGAIRHPNLVEVFDVERSGDILWYVVMEYVPGMTLGRLIENVEAKRLRLPLVSVLEIGLGATAGLSALHEARRAGGRALNIVHRDIKPSNIMLDLHGRVRVLDLGIASAEGAPGGTGSGWVKGTPAYMAPEQEEGGDLGPPADLFALGAVLFELRTGERLFTGGELYDILRQKRRGQAAASLLRRSAQLGPLKSVLERCLARDPAERPQTAAALGAELEQLRRALPRCPGLEALVRAMVAGELPQGPLADPEWAALVDAFDEPFFPAGSPSLAPLTREPAADSSDGALGEPPPTLRSGPGSNAQPEPPHESLDDPFTRLSDELIVAPEPKRAARIPVSTVEAKSEQRAPMLSGAVMLLVLLALVCALGGLGLWLFVTLSAPDSVSDLNQPEGDQGASTAQAIPAEVTPAEATRSAAAPGPAVATVLPSEAAPATPCPEGTVSESCPTKEEVEATTAPPDNKGSGKARKASPAQTLTSCYKDGDKDGYGDAAQLVETAGDCAAGMVTNDDDCADNDATRNPNVKERRSNAVDDNCDGIVNEMPDRPCRTVDVSDISNVRSGRKVSVSAKVRDPEIVLARMQVYWWTDEGGGSSPNVVNLGSEAEGQWSAVIDTNTKSRMSYYLVCQPLSGTSETVGPYTHIRPRLVE